MKYLDEFREAPAVHKLAARIHNLTTNNWTLMEVCGGQTHSLIRYGIDTLLPDKISLIHGPGCPVCVTPIEQIDKAIELSQKTNIIFCSFGDMLRVPGSEKDLFYAKANGGDIRIVYSPMDAVGIAQKNPEKEVIFFAVGFETTAPANAMAVYQAAKLGLKNFSILCSHVLVPPAMEAILSSPENRVQGFLAAGHVCTIMGEKEYEPIADKYKVPIVVTGFEPLDLMQGIYYCVKQLEEGRHEVENQYDRSVRVEGNLPAKQMIAKVFHVIPRQWRGIGSIPHSGLGIRPEFSSFDAEARFDFRQPMVCENPECIAGKVLQGIKKPKDCPAFGTRCTPDHPLGAPMVSTEGACSAYYNHRSRHA
ncbi:MAG: hydrogenase formation protein HypD [Verrucomicrobia bacterium]|nr:hydrogenase formation protein HypD [Verrucomicrobiota bacterium]MDA1068000.1 hydrogenase formation protein HypD [Verrucomicrobiota bacterium]